MRMVNFWVFGEAGDVDVDVDVNVDCGWGHGREIRYLYNNSCIRRVKSPWTRNFHEEILDRKI